MSSPKQTYISVLSFTSVKLRLIQTDLKGEFLFIFFFFADFTASKDECGVQWLFFAIFKEKKLRQK